jgi:hypothetical protein
MPLSLLFASRKRSDFCFTLLRSVNAPFPEFQGYLRHCKFYFRLIAKLLFYAEASELRSRQHLRLGNIRRRALCFFLLLADWRSYYMETKSCVNKKAQACTKSIFLDTCSVAQIDISSVNRQGDGIA